MAADMTWPDDLPNWDRPRNLPRYPIYIPSKSRWQNPLTIKGLQKWGVPFRVVVEAEQVGEYAAIAGSGNVLVLPESGNGLYWARNWIKDYSISQGEVAHWQLDDNIRGLRRIFRDRRLVAPFGTGLRVIEDFTDRYENIAISGPNYMMFGITGAPKPLATNVHVYSCSLINNACPNRWRLVYNDDTDYCLQALATGWCTALINVFVCDKLTTMIMPGGNTDDLYQGDGRLWMARSLERMWPGVVEVDRRWNRPQHIVKSAWRKFSTPLRLREGVDLDALPETDEYGLRMVLPKGEVKSEALKKQVGI